MKSHVLSVGQCSADDYHLGKMLNLEADAHMDRAHTIGEARGMMQAHPYDLVMVNRIVDGDGRSGTEFIEEMVKAGGAPPMMLVSDDVAAQEAAVAAGAMKGFGKSALGTPEVGQHMREVLHSCTRAGELRK